MKWVARAALRTEVELFFGNVMEGGPKKSGNGRPDP